jgi:sugar phosphate isomerase/epimerase
MPTIALSTGSLHTYGIARVFELAAEAGFEAIELMIDHRWDSRQPAYLRRLSAASGLPVVAVHCPFIIIRTPGWPHSAIGRLQESATLAQKVGANIVVAHLPLRIGVARIELFGPGKRSLLLPIPLGGEQDYRHFLLNELAAFETARGIRVAIENMPVRQLLGHRVDVHCLNNPEMLVQLPHLTLDTTHVGTWGLDLLAVYEHLKERIVHIHLSNFNGQEHQLLEDGHLPLAELLRRLQTDGYDGVVSVELGPEALQAEDEGQVRAHLRRAVAFCQNHTSRG